ncbi:MAG: nucleotidyltransferase substrate binding protein [Chlamydiae bacterium]|nr:nucleotidyltransferase substrate binding protein [Chlamydiota bacterium]MBI3276634.1 nucleotidyltransferase substrate binding protein [Chlamydiota bacterium]
MKDELKYAISKFGKAVTRLKEGARRSRDDLDKDGVIQRFEFTFELLWKSLKMFLEDQGILCKTPKECLQASYRVQMIQDEQIFLNMLVDRNKTSHIYDNEESEKIFQKIRDSYIPVLDHVLAKLESSLKNS